MRPLTLDDLIPLEEYAGRRREFFDSYQRYLDRYRRVRELAPVHRSGLGFWVLSRYDDCQQILRDPRFGKADADDRRARLPAEVAEAVERIRRRAPSMLFVNPPDHTRLRGLVSKAFTARTVERMRPHIARLLDELLDDVDASGDDAVDVMAAVAFPLPVTVIGETVPSSTGRLSRNRWPSRVTSYCARNPVATVGPFRRLGLKRGKDVPTSSTASPFNGTATSCPSAA